jgi:hypothetical protein
MESGKLLANKTVPVGFTATSNGLLAGNGDPAIGASAPLAPMLKTDILPEA